MYVQRNVVARSRNHFALEMQEYILCVLFSDISLSAL